MRRLMMLLPALLAGCATATTGPSDPSEYAGFYENGFEMDSFQRCGERSAWWVTDAPQLRKRYAEVARAPYERVYVVLRGSVGPEGKYGHLGLFSRELSVSEVLEMRPARQGDCT